MKAVRFIHDDKGFSSLGMVVALLVTLSLVFSAAQVYRVNAASADVQDVADAAALAAENEVAEFMIVVRVCDAVVLSLSLAGVTACGLGVAALCIPGGAALSERLITIGADLFKARDSFSEKAMSALNDLQKALPFLAAANAASIGSSNSDAAGSEYVAVALLSPFEGDPIGVDAVEGTGEFEESFAENKDAIAEAATKAEELAAEANDVKERAFARDCGDAPGYCMYERASTLAGLSGSDNPLYRSVDAWSFEVALKRAQAYYPRRLASEAPEGGSVAEQARSALRKRFYQYAVAEVSRGYVHDSDDSFDAYFPILPSNTSEMRSTRLYTESVYPITHRGEASTMHAWDGCPAVDGVAARGSISDMESGGYETCATCGFAASSMGSVAAASTSIENGFEYHYEAVAEAAAEYARIRDELDPLARTVKDSSKSLIDQLGGIAESAASKRIDAL